MANPISDVGNKIKTFSKSSDMDAVAGAIGTLAGVALVPFTPQIVQLGAWAKISNILYGIAAIIFGAWIKHDAIGYFFIGLGIAYLVDGAIRTLIPSATSSSSYALAAAVGTVANGHATQSQGVYSGSVMFNG